MLTLLSKRKEEAYTVREFMAGKHKESNCQTSYRKYTPLFSFMGIDITGHSMFSNFNMPYIVVFGVAGILLISTLIEHTVAAYGNERQAEAIATTTNLILPIAFYVFLLIGIMKIL
jgi:hypothetical protein